MRVEDNNEIQITNNKSTKCKPLTLCLVAKPLHEKSYRLLDPVLLSWRLSQRATACDSHPFSRPTTSIIRETMGRSATKPLNKPACCSDTKRYWCGLACLNKVPSRPHLAMLQILDSCVAFPTALQLLSESTKPKANAPFLPETHHVLTPALVTLIFSFLSTPRWRLPLHNGRIPTNLTCPGYDPPLQWASPPDAAPSRLSWKNSRLDRLIELMSQRDLHGHPFQGPCRLDPAKDLAASYSLPQILHHAILASTFISQAFRLVCLHQLSCRNL